MDCDPGGSGPKRYFPILIGLFAVPFTIAVEQFAQVNPQD
jgi:hypothetical protein